jgi:hypothetical protein
MLRLLQVDSPESGRFASKPMFARSCGASPAGSHTPSLGAGIAAIRSNQVEPAAASLRAAEGGTTADPAQMAERYGPESPVPEWRKRRR